MSKAFAPVVVQLAGHLHRAPERLVALLLAFRKVLAQGNAEEEQRATYAEPVAERLVQRKAAARFRWFVVGPVSVRGNRARPGSRFPAWSPSAEAIDEALIDEAFVPVMADRRMVSTVAVFSARTRTGVGSGACSSACIEPAPPLDDLARKP